MWCVTDHEAEDEGTIRRHRAAGVEIPVVAKLPAAGQGRAPGARVATSTVLVVEQYLESPDAAVWIYVGDGFAQHLELTQESMRRVAIVLGEGAR